MSCSGSFSYINFVHNVAGGPAVDIWVDGKTLLTGVEYKAVSPFFKVPVDVDIANELHSIEIYAGGKMLFGFDVGLHDGDNLTAVVVGDIKDLDSLRVEILSNSMNECKEATSYLRFFHGAATVPNVDVYANGSKVLSDVAYMDVSDYLTVPSNKTIDILVKPAGSDSVVLGPIPLMLNSGESYTVIASGKLKEFNTPITALVSKERGMCVYTDCMLR